jgi:hypothetical protein
METSESQKRFAELLRAAREAGMPRVRWSDVLTGELSAQEQSILDAYFSRFTMSIRDGDPPETRRCPGCRSRVLGGLEGAMLGGAEGNCTLQWALANGEATCTKCGWPYRVYHREIGGVIEFLAFSLPYHPEHVELMLEAVEEAEKN